MWGFLAFGEKVKSDVFTIIGLIMLIIGVIGLSFSSAPDATSNEIDNNDIKAPLLERKDTSPTIGIADDVDIGWFEPDAFSDGSFVTVLDDSSSSQEDAKDVDEENNDCLTICGMEISRFHLGIFCAFLNGVNSGSVLVPMHYSG